MQTPPHKVRSPGSSDACTPPTPPSLTEPRKRARALRAQAGLGQDDPFTPSPPEAKKLRSSDPAPSTTTPESDGAAMSVDEKKGVAHTEDMATRKVLSSAVQPTAVKKQ